MADKSAIAAAEKQLNVFTHNLVLLTETLDEAAEANNLEAVRAAQSDITATQALIESTQRKITKLSKQLTEDEKQAQREANTAAAGTVETAAAAALKAIGKAEKHLASFIDALREAHQHGALAADATYPLVRQMPEKQKRGLYEITNGLNLTDSSLAAAIESDMQRAGLFHKVAPSSWLRLQRHDLPPLTEVMERRISRLVAAVKKLADNANAAI